MTHSIELTRRLDFGTAIFLTSLITVIASFRRAFLSDLYGLVASVQDGSVYYVLPAFNFSSVSFGSFTFDGRNPTDYVARLDYPPKTE